MGSAPHSAVTARRTGYDVLNLVRTDDPKGVNAEVGRIFKALFPSGDYSAVDRTFRDVARLFAGDYPGFFACDCFYHDLRHTLETCLAMMRIIDGHEKTRAAPDRFGPELTSLGLVTALLHDSGYMRHRRDTRHQTGAEYTLNHIQRSRKFIEHYLPELGMAELVPAACRIVSLTGVEVKTDRVLFTDDRERRLGYMLGTADFLGQMSDRVYLEKCRDFLYPEFEAGSVTVRMTNDGHKQVLYASAEDLLTKTPGFYEHVVKPRLENDFERVFDYAAVHFGGVNHYMVEIEKNIAYLLKVIDSQDWSQLRRKVDSLAG